MKWLKKLFGITETMVDEAIKEVSELMPTHTESTKRSYDNNKLTNVHLRHLVNVYDKQMLGVKTYKDLAQYANERYGMNKSENTIYNRVQAYRKSLEK